MYISEPIHVLCRLHDFSTTGEHYAFKACFNRNISLMKNLLRILEKFNLSQINANTTATTT